MMNFMPTRSVTLSDVAVWAEKERQVDDRRALARVATLWQNVPLASRKLDVSAFETHFPLHGFDAAQHKSEAAYKAWRRKVIAVLKAYVAHSAPKPVALPVAPKDPAPQDWDHLITVVEDTAAAGEPAPFSSKRVIPVKVLARLARPHGISPKSLTAENLRSLAAGLTGHERSSIIRALRNLNMLRAIPEIASLLPSDMFPLDFLPRKGVIGDLPEPISLQIESWLDTSCAGTWDTVAQVWSDGTSAHDRQNKSVALRRYCVAAIAECPALPPEIGLSDLITEDLMVKVLRRWLGETGKPLKDRSVMTYYSSVKAVAAHNGIDVSIFDALEKSTAALRRGKISGKSMSQRTQKFCASLLDSPALQTRLLTLHIRARKLAQLIFDRAAADKRELSAVEAGRVRQLGTVAAFAAIETCAAPFRIERVTQFVLSGPSADVLLPAKGIPTARFLRSAKQNPNKRTIAAALKQDRRNGLDTLMWYIEHVRPLFTEGHASEYLFPAVGSLGPMRKTMLYGWFKKLSRQLGIPMTPHNFRHAIASLLIKKYPGQYEAVAVLLGDTEGTVRTYYAWVNQRVQVESAQALVLELGNAA